MTPGARLTRLTAQLRRRGVRLVRKLLRRRRTPALDGGVCVISYPKAGRTWLRVLVGKALCTLYDLPDGLILKPYKLTARAGLPKTKFLHDGSSQKLKTPYARLSADKRAYAGAKVIVLVRDPRDVLVSAYFEASRRLRVFDGTLSAYLRTEAFGVRKLATFYDHWYRNRMVPRAFLVLRYEAMREDPVRALAEVLRFMGMERVEPAVLQQAVAFASFQNMKALETGDHFKSRRMRPANAADPESFKVRRGVIGGYRDYMSEDDIAYVDEVVTEVGCPWLLPSVRAGGRDTPGAGSIPIP